MAFLMQPIGLGYLLGGSRRPSGFLAFVSVDLVEW